MMFRAIESRSTSLRRELHAAAAVLSYQGYLVARTVFVVFVVVYPSAPPLGRDTCLRSTKHRQASPSLSLRVFHFKFAFSQHTVLLSNSGHLYIILFISCIYCWIQFFGTPLLINKSVTAFICFPCTSTSMPAPFPGMGDTAIDEHPVSKESRKWPAIAHQTWQMRKRV